MRYQRPKGTADILPGDSQTWQYVEGQARQILKLMATKKFEHRSLNPTTSSPVRPVTRPTW